MLRHDSFVWSTTKDWVVSLMATVTASTDLLVIRVDSWWLSTWMGSQPVHLPREKEKAVPQIVVALMIFVVTRSMAFASSQFQKVDLAAHLP